jgi:hypothetical protein
MGVKYNACSMPGELPLHWLGIFCGLLARLPAAPTRNEALCTQHTIVSELHTLDMSLLQMCTAPRAARKCSKRLPRKVRN